MLNITITNLTDNDISLELDGNMYLIGGQNTFSPKLGTSRWPKAGEIIKRRGNLLATIAFIQIPEEFESMKLEAIGFMLDGSYVEKGFIIEDIPTRCPVIAVTN